MEEEDAGCGEGGTEEGGVGAEERDPVKGRTWGGVSNAFGGKRGRSCVPEK